MLKRRKQIAVNDAAEFLSRSFTSGETIAISSGGYLRS